jgi:hypothetical protein
MIMQNNIMNKVYIAREYLMIDDYGGVRIDEEEVFSSFSDAKNYLTTLEDINAEGNDYLLFRTEILEFVIGKTKSCIRKWTFKLNGDLIDVKPPMDSNFEKALSVFTWKYNVGDIVFVMPRIENKFSPSIRGTYGVIVETPAANLNHDAALNDEGAWNNKYVVYYISENGLLSHLHVIESAMVLSKTGVPTDLKFLELYSNYLKNRTGLSDELVSQLLNEKVFVKNIKVFDFKRIGVIE